MTPDLRLLKPALDDLYCRYDRAAALADPIEIVRRYQDPADREVAGFLAAALAFGRVASVLQTVERVMAVLGPSPARAVRGFEPARDAPSIRPIVHRWSRGDDIVALVWIVGRMLEAAGSIESFFTDGDDESGEDLGPTLESFGRRALAFDLRPVYAGRRPRPGVAYFFPCPSTGSACKRLNLFLRWMVRHDAVDLGVWKRVRPSRLVIPLDTHVIRVGRCLRLTARRSPGWAMATDITRSLRELDSDDPVRYDFALCHLGMHGLCGFGTPRGDQQCPLKGLCRP